MYMYQDSLCVSRLPPVSLEAQVNMDRARAAAAATREDPHAAAF
jgi:hypothetical protein